MEVRESRICIAVCAGGLMHMIIGLMSCMEVLRNAIVSGGITISDYLIGFLFVIGSLYSMGVLFTFLYDSTCVVTIDEKGVRNRNRFYEEYLAWEEIKDYGVVDKHGKNIYFSGRRFSSKERLHLDKVVLLRYGSILEEAWYPAAIRGKRNQKKEDIIIRIEYTDERWRYIRTQRVLSLASHRKELLEEHLEELESGTGN